MQERSYLKGSIISEQDTPLKSIMFVLSGQVDLEIRDQVTNDVFLLESLHQGDVIGQYTVLYPNQNLMFRVKASSHVRLLHLPVSFFTEKRFIVPHLEVVLKKGM